MARIGILRSALVAVVGPGIGGTYDLTSISNTISGVGDRTSYISTCSAPPSGPSFDFLSSRAIAFFGAQLARHVG